MRHKNSKYRLNERYFQVIDTEEKAYWLGFIMADGGLSKQNFTIGLSFKDRNHLEKFLEAIESNSPIKDRIQKVRKKAYKQSFVRICSTTMVNDLKEHGVDERKSLTSRAWRGEGTLLLLSYWRGMVDGDGWISFINSKNRGKVYSVGLCGTYDVVKAFSDFIAANCDLHVEPQPHGKIWQISFGGTFAPQRVANLLYQNATTYLDRKYKRAIHLSKQLFTQSKFAPRKDVSDDDLKRVYAETLSTKKTGKHFYLDARTVSRRLKQIGVKLRTNRWDLEVA